MNASSGDEAQRQGEESGAATLVECSKETQVAIDRKQLSRRWANHFISFVAKEIVLRIATPINSRQLIPVGRVSIGVAMIDSGYCAESSPVVNNTHANFLKC